MTESYAGRRLKLFTTSIPNVLSASRADFDTPKYRAGERSNMADDHDDRPAYDPTEPTPPAREPPYRRTAPQGEFTRNQVLLGFVVLLLGLFVTFGLPFGLGLA